MAKLHAAGYSAGAYETHQYRRLPRGSASFRQKENKILEDTQRYPTKKVSKEQGHGAPFVARREREVSPPAPLVELNTRRPRTSKNIFPGRNAKKRRQVSV